MNDDKNAARAAHDQEIAALWNRWSQTPIDIRHEVMDAIQMDSETARSLIDEWPNQWLDFLLCASVIGLREMILQCDGDNPHES